MNNMEDPFFEIGDSDERGVIEVVGPSGSKYEVIHEKEKDYWDQAVKQYLTDYKFTNISDKQDLDRVIFMELLIYRYQLWVSLEKDYEGESIDVEMFNRAIKEKSAELRQIKKSLGIDKSSREKDQGESFAKYVEKVRQRAHEFGVMRNEQAVSSITLFQELSALITFHDKCNEQERKDNHIEIYDIIAWIRDKAIPEFEEIDKKFRETTQKYWIADQ